MNFFCETKHSVNFFVANFRHFAKNPLENNIWSQVPCFLGNRSPKNLFKNRQKSPQLPTL
jgi:hypothetical protein